MKSYTQHIDDLLVKQLTGEATEAEREQVQQWLAMDEDNQHYFDHFKLIWEESVHLANNSTVDEQAAWERFQQYSRQQATPRSKASIINLHHPLMRAAVIVGIVVGIACITYFLFSNNPGNVISLATVQATGAVKTDSLPDGSAVILNKHSQISYPNRFSSDKRVVQLNGEAFFKVTPNKEKPFEVHTNNVTITVVGTSFNVRSRGDTTEIIVETGIVKVEVGQQIVTLHAGEKAVTRTQEAQLQKQSNTDQLYNYYRSKKFVCDNTPLWKLVDKLNEAYETHIVIENPELRNWPLTTTFDNEPLPEIFKIIEKTFDNKISVTKENGEFILR